MTRTARRLAAVAAAAALCVPLAITATPASAASPCATDCISSAAASATTRAITLDVRTTGYVSVKAEIWNDAATARVGYGIVAAGTPVWFNSFRFTSGSTTLAQNTRYKVKVMATDMLGKAVTEWVPVRVKQRIADYFITKLTVIDDSDYAGAGEFRAGWKAGTTVRKSLWNGVSSKSSGQYWNWTEANPLAHITRFKEISTPKVFLQLSDDDTWGLNNCGSAWAPDFTSGSNDCADWATAGAALVLPETSGTVPFTLRVAKNAAVKFVVTGKVVQVVG